MKIKMKKNEKKVKSIVNNIFKHWGIDTVLIIVSILIFMFLLQNSLRGLNFDQEEDVCERYIDDWGDSCFLGEENCNENGKNIMDSYCCNPSFVNKIEHYYCYEFHPKSFCEKCVDDWTTRCDEECVCEEYEDYSRELKINDENEYKIDQWGGYYIKYTYPVNKTIINITKKCIIHRQDMDDKYHTHIEDINCTILKDNSYKREYYITDLAECTSAREVTECEKNNVDYILDNTTFEGNNCKVYACLYQGVNYKSNSFCREKRLYDFTCQELLKPLLLDWNKITIIKGKIIEDCYIFKLNKCYDEDEIYDTLISKGCEVRVKN